VQTWRQRSSLSPEIVDRLHYVNWHLETPVELKALASQVFDGVIIESFLDTVLRFARWFSKPILYRVFGRGGDRSYSDYYGAAAIAELTQTPAYRQGLYHWCPILPTLGHAEIETLVRNEVVLEPFVSSERLATQWHAESSEPYVAMVLSRIQQVECYVNMYRQITSRFRRAPSLPLRILGGNHPGSFNDPEIVGALPDRDYFQMIARARVFFYQGDSQVHLHWSVLEALAMGVPVVMLQSGYLAWALIRTAGPKARGVEWGVVEGLDEARQLLAQCLSDRSVAAGIAYRQQPLAQYITDRAHAVRQYRHKLQAILEPGSRQTPEFRAA
jgi:glycosyltransferase involved in cell wall biosynthesis